MKIAVIGTGYVGLVTGACLSDYGNDVYCVDVNEDKIEKLRNGIMPIYEPGLAGMVVSSHAAGRLHFTAELSEALQHADVCFIAVGTPMGEDGSADLQYVLAAAGDIGKYMTHHMYVVDKSTVPVGTAQKVRRAIQQELDARSSALTFDVVSNPEFLKEGTAVSDCSNPDRIVIGTDNDRAAKVMREMYRPFVRNNETFIFMDIASAEMTKYAANAMLAAKISFMNEISNICEAVGADVNKVRMGIGSDHRIGYHFIYAGCGYGGSCFPKDVQALIKTGSDHGCAVRMLQAVEDVNQAQKMVIPEKVARRFGDSLDGKTFGVWGLAFKPDTDDMREAAAITVIKELTMRGGKVKAYDPQAMGQAESCYLAGNSLVSYCPSKYTALVDADAVILMTEWKEFQAPDFAEMKKRLKTPVVFDGRNQYDAGQMEEMGFEYYQIGVGKEKTA